LPITNGDEAREAGRSLCRRLALEMAIITLDRDGMALVRHDGIDRRLTDVHGHVLHPLLA